jgi:hypothetical protein
MARFLALALLLASASAGPAIARLGRVVKNLPPRSRYLESFGKNGSSIPANGAVWPTAIYWCNVEVGTPPQSFPVAIDSGSGDLDIGAKGCNGCVTTPPNNAYDHTASSTAKPALPFKFSNSYQTCDLSDPTAVCTITGGLYTDQVSLAGLGPVEVEVGQSICTHSNSYAYSLFALQVLSKSRRQISTSLRRSTA